MNEEDPNIVLMTNSLGWGGTEGHVIDIAIGFTGRGIYPVVLVDMPPLDRLNILEKLGVRVEIITDNPDISKSEYKKLLKQKLKELNPDIIHLNIWGERRFIILKMIKKLRIPVIQTFHTTMVKMNLRSKIQRFHNWKEKNFCKKIVTAIVRLHSQWSERRLYKKLLPAVVNISDISQDNYLVSNPFIKKTKRIYCGTYIPEKPNDLGNDEKGVKVLWIGSMIERKRPLLALEIWGKIAAEFMDAQLIMVGDGPEMARVKEKVENMPQGSVVLSGNIPDLRPVLEKGHIMFHTSTAEGIPKNIIFGMNFGMPIVAANAGATSEAVINGSNGFLTEIYDEKELYSCLRKIIADSNLRKEMGTVGRIRGENFFSIYVMMDNIISAYRDLCGVNLTEKQVNNYDYNELPLA